MAVWLAYCLFNSLVLTTLPLANLYLGFRTLYSRQFAVVIESFPSFKPSSLITFYGPFLYLVTRHQRQWPHTCSIHLVYGKFAIPSAVVTQLLPATAFTFNLLMPIFSQSSSFEHRFRHPSQSTFYKSNMCLDLLNLRNKAANAPQISDPESLVVATLKTL